MTNDKLRVARDTENPDPQELNKPIPKLFLVVVAVLLGWAVYYISQQAPGLGSSSEGSAPTKASSGADRLAR